jgi:hypothetical protein
MQRVSSTIAGLYMLGPRTNDWNLDSGARATQGALWDAAELEDCVGYGLGLVNNMFT